MTYLIGLILAVLVTAILAGVDLSRTIHTESRTLFNLAHFLIGLAAIMVAWAEKISLVALLIGLIALYSVVALGLNFFLRGVRQL